MVHDPPKLTDLLEAERISEHSMLTAGGPSIKDVFAWGPGYDAGRGSLHDAARASLATPAEGGTTPRPLDWRR